MKKLAEYIIKNIVNNPKEVEVTEVEDTNNNILKLNVKAQKEDIGIIIGKGGTIIKAIRNLLRIKAIPLKKQVEINVVETSES